MQNYLNMEKYGGVVAILLDNVEDKLANTSMKSINDLEAILNSIEYEVFETVKCRHWLHQFALTLFIAFGLVFNDGGGHSRQPLPRAAESLRASDP